MRIMCQSGKGGEREEGEREREVRGDGGRKGEGAVREGAEGRRESGAVRESGWRYITICL